MQIWKIKPNNNSVMPDLSTGVVVASHIQAAEEIAALNQATIIDGTQAPWDAKSSAFLAWNYL
jgi:hypothetical protein